MSNGISGYNAGRINPYRPIEQRGDVSQGPDASKAASADLAAPQRPVSGSDLTEAESRMIGRYFPESEQMKLRLYGPGAGSKSIEPEVRGRKLDLRG